MTEREQYEAWFRDFYKQEPMPELGAPAHDFCWAGYRAGAASRDAEIAELVAALEHSVLYVPDLATVPGIAAVLAKVRKP